MSSKTKKSATPAPPPPSPEMLAKQQALDKFRAECTERARVLNEQRAAEAAAKEVS